MCACSIMTRLCAYSNLKNIRAFKGKGKDRGLVENEKRQWRIINDRSFHTNLVSDFADIANIVDKGKREKS